MFLASGVIGTNEVMFRRSEGDEGYLKYVLNFVDICYMIDNCGPIQTY